MTDAYTYDPSRKFTGKERDSESGLDNFGARYNSSTMGRFMSPDAFYKDSHVGDPQRRVATRLITCAERGAAPFGFCFSKGAGFDFSSFLTLFTANPKSIRIVTTTQ
jgi:RHS repeat-associated protein